MKVTLKALLIMTLLALNAPAQQAIQPPPPPHPGPSMPPGLMKGMTSNTPPPKMPDKETLSYFIGMSVGNSIKKQELTVNVDTIAAAIIDVISNRTTRFNEAQFASIQREVGGALRAKMTEQRQAEQAKLEKEGAENKIKADAFLADNAKGADIKSLANGIQYKVIKDGTGTTPGPKDSVTVAYKGSLIDGTVFDQNEKFSTRVTGQTIKGWSEVLQQMKVGSKWQVFIPPDLAYGPRGQGKIPPQSVLIFDMDLLSDTPAPVAVPPAANARPPGANAHPPAPATASAVSGQIIKVPSADELKHGAKIEVITNASASTQ
jgi:FKBP-type peptidyl-prolyl cis-trans isomerase FklB